MKRKGGGAVSNGEFRVVRERRGAGIPLSLTYVTMGGDSTADKRINELISRLVREGERFAERAAESLGRGTMASVIINGTSNGKELHLTLSLSARRGAKFVSHADFDFCLSLSSGRLTRFKRKTSVAREKK